MSVTEIKSQSPDTCVSGVPPGEPEPEIRSADIVLTWADVEPTRGAYNWSTLALAAGRARLVRGKLMVLLWTGQDSPHWLYGPGLGHSGVPMLAHNTDSSIVVPDYTSATYQRRLHAVHASMALAIRSLALGPQMMAIQPCLGSTGDDTPIHVTSGNGIGTNYSFINRTLLAEIGGPGSSSNSTWWVTFSRDFAIWLATNSSAFAEPVASRELVLLLNGQGVSFPFTWIAANLPGSFLKFGQTGHAYQSNYERFRCAQQAPFVYSLQRGLPVRARAELSSETCWTLPGPFANASACSVPWNVYAMTMWVATAHLDFWNVQPSSDTNILGAFRPLWRFLNRYAGLRWAWQPRGAWIGFRDGLDAMDTVRFSEAQFGPLSVTTITRDGYPELACSPSGKLARVCEAHASQGCKIDVPTALCGGPMTQRRARGMNDVAFGNWRGDYGGFLRQLDPEASRGWWRLGNESELFGRFARSFVDPSNRSAVLPLKLDTGLWGGLPFSTVTSPTLTVRLVFLAPGRDRSALATMASGVPRPWPRYPRLALDGGVNCARRWPMLGLAAVDLVEETFGWPTRTARTMSLTRSRWSRAMRQSLPWPVATGTDHHGCSVTVTVAVNVCPLSARTFTIDRRR